MNKHVFPPQDYKHCSFFLFVENNISFVQIFTRLILENQVPLKCNILKHNRGRLTERPTKTLPKPSPARGTLGGRLHQGPALKPEAEKD